MQQRLREQESLRDSEAKEQEDVNRISRELHEAKMELEHVKEDRERQLVSLRAKHEAEVRSATFEAERRASHDLETKIDKELEHWKKIGREAASAAAVSLSGSSVDETG